MLATTAAHFAATCVGLGYMSVQEVVLTLGPGALLAKSILKRLIEWFHAVHPDDRQLLGMVWKRQLFVEAVLPPFGLRSAPKLFNALADALEWISRRQGIGRVAHYLDDFILASAPNFNECAYNLQVLLGTFHIAHHKVEGPTTCLTFLGIEINSRFGCPTINCSLCRHC